VEGRPPSTDALLRRAATEREIQGRRSFPEPYQAVREQGPAYVASLTGSAPPKERDARWRELEDT